MASKKFFVFSRKLLLLLLLVVPRRDPLCFSAHSGRSLILDPGVSLPLCFSAQSGGRDLPDATGILSVLRLFPCQEMTDALQELSRCYLLSICLLGLLMFICGQSRKPMLVTNKNCILVMCIINTQCNSCRWINKENLPPTCMYKVFI